jgi:uncharacterized protein YciI
MADDDLIPAQCDKFTIVLLVRPPDTPALSDDELDRLQAAHLTYLRDLGRQGVLVANGPFDQQLDERFRGMSVYATSVDEARRLASQDPAVRAGRLAVEVMDRWTAAGSAHFG